MDLDRLARKYLKQYFLTHSEVIAENDLIAHVGRELEIDEDNLSLIKDWLSSKFEEVLGGTVIRDFDAYSSEYCYQARGAFYNGAQFLIRPTGYELVQGILIPGDRFYPFCFDRLPDKIKLKNEGEVLRRHVIQMTMQQSKMYHALLGTELFHTLTCRDPFNASKMADADVNDDQELKFTVFGMKAFYNQHSFKAGDAIMATVSDWSKGTCDLEFIPASFFRDKADEVDQWCEAMESLVAEQIATDECAWESTTFKQLEIALFRGLHRDGMNLMDAPPINSGGFLAQSKKIALMPCHERVLFWNTDGASPNDIAEKNEENLISGDGAETVTFNTDSFDGLMKTMGISLNEDQFEAYVRDELFADGNNLDRVKKRCFDECTTLTHPDIQSNLSAYCENIWERVKNVYDRSSDDEIGDVRHSLLALVEKHDKWLRSIEEYNDSPKGMPYKETTELTEIISMISDTVILMNSDDSVAKQEMEIFRTMADQLEPIITLLMKNITEILEGR